MAAVLHVITAAARRGAEVHATCLHEALLAEGWQSRLVALERGAGTLDTAVLGPSSLSPASLRALRRLARDVDVVVAHGARTLPASAVALVGTGTPFVYRSIGDPDAWVVGTAARLRTGAALRRAAGVVALWDGAADRLSQLHGVPRHRFTVIPNAVELVARPLVPVPGAGRLAFVGSLSEEKRPRLALDAAHLAGAPLEVAGDGPLRAELEAVAAARGQDVTFLGAVPDVTPVYDRADALLLTSRTEGQPAVIAEAAQRGRACVATSVGGIAAMLQDGATGRLVGSSPTREQVAGAVREVLASAAEMGEAAHASLGRTSTIRHVVEPWSALLRSYQHVE